MMVRSQHVNASRFVEDNRNRSAGGVHANAAMTQFAGWLVTMRGQLPDHDHATLFSKSAAALTV